MPKSNEFTPMYDDLPEHKKTRALRALTGWNLWQTLGFLYMLWRQVGKDSPYGELSDLASPERILDAIGCNKEKIPEVIDALVESRFIEGNTTDGYKVHDWEEGAGKFTVKKERDRIRKREERDKAKSADSVHGQSTDSPRTCEGQSTDESRTVHAQENQVTQRKETKITQGVLGEPPGFSNSSFSGSRVAGLQHTDELPCDSLGPDHVFAVFRDLFLENGVNRATDLSVKAVKCGVTPAMWTMLFLDKVHYAYGLEDGEPRIDDGKTDPVALTMAGFKRKQVPTEAAGVLFREIFIDIVGNPKTRGKRWCVLSGEVIAEEMRKRKGKNEQVGISTRLG